MTSDRPSAVMLFAAGLGTRMGAMTKDCPKPLIPVSGLPLIDHALNWIRDAEIERIVVNSHYKSDMIHRHLAGQNIVFSPELETVLETGGGLRQALPLLGPGPVFTFNPDVVWHGPNPLTLLSSAWQPDHMDALLMLIPKARAHAHSGAGDFMLDAKNCITRGPGLIYSGAQIIRTDRLSVIRKRAFSLNLVWDDLIARRRVYGITYPGMWCDVGTPEGISAAETLLQGQHNV